MVDYKTCRKCGVRKENTRFNRCSRNSDGLQSYCKSCRKAHYAQNRVSSTPYTPEVDRSLDPPGFRSCARCKELKTVSCFGGRADRPSGLDSWCLACHGSARAEWRHENPERARAASRRAYRRHRARRVAQTREWREANRGYFKDYYRENRARYFAHAAVRRARVRDASVVPFSTSDLELRLSMWAGCWMCGAPADCVDHVKPLAKGGAHILSNLRPACRSCNASKGAKWPFAPVSFSLEGV